MLLARTCHINLGLLSQQSTNTSTLDYSVRSVHLLTNPLTLPISCCPVSGQALTGFGVDMLKYAR